MRRRTDLKGLPVVRVDSGETVGRVRDVVLDLEHGRLLGLKVALGRREVFVPWDDIHGLGVSAVTVEAGVVLGKDRGAPGQGGAARGDATRAAAEGAADSEGEPGASHVAAPGVLGKRVLSRDGREVGLVDDVIIDAESGSVWGYQVSGGFISDFVDGKRGVPLTDELVVGPDTVILGEDYPRDGGEGGANS